MASEEEMLIPISSVHPSTTIWTSLSLSFPVCKMAPCPVFHRDCHTSPSPKPRQAHVSRLISWMKKLRPRANQGPTQGHVSRSRAGVRVQVCLTSVCVLDQMRSALRWCLRDGYTAVLGPSRQRGFLQEHAGGDIKHKTE